MLNIIWLLFIVIGVVVAGLHGNIGIITTAALEAADKGVDISIKMVGTMSLWLGIMKIAEDAGLMEKLANLIRPIAKYLFPNVPKDHPAMGSIIMNMSANLLGLGNAATPLGLKAMQELQELNNDSDKASDAMCTLLALNTSSLTLIPATVIVLRSSAGSINPAEIVGTTIFATTCSTVAAVIIDRTLRNFSK